MDKSFTMAFRIGLIAFFLGTICFLSGESSDDLKIWIFFKDRPYLKAGNVPTLQAAGFSREAIQRRVARGLESWNESDMPVDSSYVESVKAAGGRVLVTSRWLNAVSAVCESRCRANLARLPFITDVRPVATYSRPLDRRSEHSSTVTAPSYSPASLDSDAAALSYGPSKHQLDQIHVPEAHRKGFAGQGITIAYFSTGFRKDHVALKGHEIVAEFDFVNGDTDTHNGVKEENGDVFNFDWPGTSDWSVAAGAFPGQIYGPAFKSKAILAVTDNLRTRTTIEEDNWVAGFEFADRMGADVIEGSLGFTNTYGASDYNGKTAISSRLASTAAKKGIVLVSDMGISGMVYLPSDATNILSVGIVDQNSVLAPFSTKGPTVDGRMKPEVLAPELKIYKAENTPMDGFTFEHVGFEASCLVAGAAAVVLSAHPDWNPLQVMEAMKKTANHADHPENGFGYGLVNVAAAIDFLPANSVVIEHTPINTRHHNGQPIAVTARIRAQRGLNLNSLSLFWKNQKSTGFQRVQLTPVPGAVDRFRASIPTASTGDVISYYLTAKDVKGKSTKAPFGPGKVFQFSIL